MKEFWNERYAKKEFIYGRTPNAFFKNFIDKQEPGSILLPADGESRNGVYAAEKGWQVFSFDFSDEARMKALSWAEQSKVEINYELADLNEWNSEQEFDTIALIFVHMEPDIREKIHKKLIKRLKPGGMIILEAFSKKQIEYDSGGPSDPDLLYNISLLNDDFSELKIDFLQERIVEIDEGNFHSGEASLIRMLAKKINI